MTLRETGPTLQVTRGMILLTGGSDSSQVLGEGRKNAGRQDPERARRGEGGMRGQCLESRVCRMERAPQLGGGDGCTMM